MVEPNDVLRAAELAAHGTDASPLEAVMDVAPPPPEAPEARASSRFDIAAEEGGERAEEPPPALSEEPSEPLWSEPTLETLYDVLGVSPQASREQIEKAHRFCLDMYKEGALATYSLLDVGDAQAARSRIGLAYETLSDAERRREYDLSLGYTPAVPHVVPFALQRAPAANEGAASEAPAALLATGPLMGAELRRIRESRGIALREVAASTKIGLRFLEYIEEDRFAMLPPPVYLRGFLQEYARVLGLDPRRMTEAYMSRLPSRP